MIWTLERRYLDQLDFSSEKSHMFNQLEGHIALCNQTVMDGGRSDWLHLRLLFIEISALKIQSEFNH